MKSAKSKPLQQITKTHHVPQTSVLFKLYPQTSIVQHPPKEKKKRRSKMKESIKFRDDEGPVLRAKVPVSLLGFPFQSGISASHGNDLCLSLATLSDSGPSVKFSYRPNDSWRPFAVAVKTGIGDLGSPSSSPMIMCAEFNLLRTGSPALFLHIRPRLGHFSARKTVASPGYDGGWAFGSAVEVRARTALPLRDGTELKLHWSVRFPEGRGEAADRTAEVVPFGGRWIPQLALCKIGVEHVEVKRGPQRGADVEEDARLATEHGRVRRTEECRARIRAGKSPAAVVDKGGEGEGNWRNKRKQKRETDDGSANDCSGLGRSEAVMVASAAAAGGN